MAQATMDTATATTKAARTGERGEPGTYPRLHSVVTDAVTIYLMTQRNG